MGIFYFTYFFFDNPLIIQIVLFRLLLDFFCVFFCSFSSVTCSHFIMWSKSNTLVVFTLDLMSLYEGEYMVFGLLGQTVISWISIWLFSRCIYLYWIYFSYTALSSSFISFLFVLSLSFFRYLFVYALNSFRCYSCPH
jgi:hypothetical protein